VKGRGTRGVIDIITSERNGEVVGMKLVADTDHVMFITERGILMRTRVSDLNTIGRNTQGVRLIKLDEGDKLVAMAKIEPDDEEATTSVPDSAPAPESPSPPATDSNDDIPI
jgi:DNA gyrase subunit A